MEEECADHQQCEMEALTAIYADGIDGQVFSYHRDGSGHISGTIAVEVDHDKEEMKEEEEWAKVQYLPPIQLHFTLPGTYPLVDAPRISLECCWLSSKALEEAQRRMEDEIWPVERGMCVLDSYISSLRYGGPLLPSLEILSKAKDEVAAYDARRRQEVFAMQTFTCAVCLEQQSGVHCVELPGCLHVHCKECLRGYWTLLIDEGN
ncbi:E3 ubiquitin-protein ligase rnf14, partial [Coemansia aciculifera]